MKTYTSTDSVPGTVLSCAGIDLLPDDLSDVCFFDIETTGLSAKVSNVYLIGAASYSNGNLHVTQWFADDYTSERALLEAFSEYLSDYAYIVHYNGSTFDIPYLEKKYADHELTSPFSRCALSKDSAQKDLISVDIYRRIQSKKKYFPTSNHKLVTMEKLLSFNRGFDLSGKECIRIYTEYMQHRYAHRDDEAENAISTLLHHNVSDLVGTALCVKLLLYTDYRPQDPSFTTEGSQIVFTEHLNGVFLPFFLSYDKPPAHIEYRDDMIRVTVPLVQGCLYHFFPDYKNYYYLPDEDMAVHKSVGSYVDSSHRRQATAATCYIKKSGTFMPLAGSSWNNKTVFFEKDQKTPAYIEVDHSASAEMISFLL